MSFAWPSCGLLTTTRTRGQSEALGFVIIFGIMLLTAVTVVTLGAGMVSDSQGQLSADRAEKVMTQMDSEISMVALGRTNSQEIQLDRYSGEQFSVDEDAGWMNVTFTNRTTQSKTELMNVTLGSVNFERGETVVAYQGGGVWRTDGETSKMISPPEFNYRGATLTLPLVTVDGDFSLDERVTVAKNGLSEQKFPNHRSNENWVNPLEDAVVEVTVQSDYYSAWGAFFEERTEGDATYDHENETVTVRLVVPPDNPPIQGGMTIGGAGTNLNISNNFDADSYDSRTGGYDPDEAGSEGRIVSAGNVEIGNARIKGDIEVGGTLTFDNPNAELIDGNVSYGNNVNAHNQSVDWKDEHWIREPYHWHAQNASVESPDSVSNDIDWRLEGLREDNDNDDEDSISSDQLDCSSDCTIESGSYFLEEFIPTGDIEFDTSAGNVDIAVDGTLDITDQDITVSGDNRVNIYVDDDATFANTDIEIPDDRSPQFWTYYRPDATIHLDNEVRYTGVIYGPGTGGSQGATVEIRPNVEIFGAIVGYMDFPQAGHSDGDGLHYDVALADTQPEVSDDSIPSITYLHVSVNPVTVENQ